MYFIWQSPPLTKQVDRWGNTAKALRDVWRKYLPGVCSLDICLIMHLHLLPHHQSLFGFICPSILPSLSVLVKPGCEAAELGTIQHIRPISLTMASARQYIQLIKRVCVCVCACKPTRCLCVTEESASLPAGPQASSQDLFNKEPVNQSLINNYLEPANIKVCVCACMCVRLTNSDI